MTFNMIRSVHSHFEERGGGLPQMFRGRYFCTFDDKYCGKQ